MKNLSIILFSIIFLIAPFKSNSQIIDSSFYRWTLYEIESDEGDKKCYMINYPTKTQTDHNFRKQPYIMITRYQGKRLEEVSIYAGYEYKIHSKVLVAIDDTKFLFATNDDMAWTRDKTEDAFVIQKMLSAATLKIRSDSAIGTFGVDEYSLKGIAKSYNRLKRICE